MMRIPDGVVILNDSSVLIADSSSYRVRIVWPNNTIGTWFGNGTAVTSGDGLYRTQATSNRPWKLTANRETGDVFIAERDSGRIRRVDGRTGIVSTVVGPTGSNATVELDILQPHDLVAVPGTTDSFVLSASASSRVFLINTASRTALLLAGTGSSSGFSGNDVPAATSRLPLVSGLLFHSASRTVLAADYANSLLRAFTIGGNVNTVAGNGTGGIFFNGTSALTWHPSGGIILSEYVGNRVRFIAASCLPTAVGSVSRLVSMHHCAVLLRFHAIATLHAAFDVGQSASIMQPPALTFPPKAGPCTSTIVAGDGVDSSAGNGGAAANASISTPSSVIVVPGSGDILVASYLSSNVRLVFAATGSIATFAGSGVYGSTGDGGFAPAAQLKTPRGLAVLPDGSVLITDFRSHRVRVIRTNGTINAWMGNGTTFSSGDGLHRRLATTRLPRKIYCHPLTGDVYLTERDGGRIRLIDGQTGLVSTVVGPEGSRALITLPFEGPHDIVALPGTTNSLLVSYSDTSRVYLINTAARTALLVAGTGDTSGFSGEGGPAVAASVTFATGLLHHAPSGTILLASRNDSRIVGFRLGGNITTLAGNGTNLTVLNSPDNLAWHPAGHLLIGNYDDNRVLALSESCLPSPPPVSLVCTSH